MNTVPIAKCKRGGGANKPHLLEEKKPLKFPLVCEFK